jgi:hypothetical protein
VSAQIHHLPKHFVPWKSAIYIQCCTCCGYIHTVLQLQHIVPWKSAIYACVPISLIGTCSVMTMLKEAVSHPSRGVNAWACVCAYDHVRGISSTIEPGGETFNKLRQQLYFSPLPYVRSILCTWCLIYRFV